jgi:hypothetical protein
MIPLLLAAGIAGASAGAVRVPSSDSAWGGVREGKGPQRVADYDLQATLDPIKHTVDGRERLTWRNRSSEPIRELYVHLYLNAFEGAGSTFALESKAYGGFRTGAAIERGEWGYIELRRVTEGGAPVPWTFAHPDGGPATDHTVVRFDLPRAVPPGGTAELEIEFHDPLPRIVARTGWFGSYHLVAQWFPKVGVLELPGERGATEPRWNCHEFHLNSEFYADFGSYRAEITLPKGYILGSVGTDVGPAQETAQGVRYHIQQDDVHDFAFTAWDRFRELSAKSDDGVAIRCLFPEGFDDDAALEIADRIAVAARTGQIGDGKVWVTPVEYLTRVRTSEVGVDAL